MQKWVLIALGALFLSFQAGCSVFPIRTAIVNDKNLEQRADIPLIDVPGQRNSKDKNRSYSAAEVNEEIKGENYCRVKYHPSYSKNQWIVVEGKLGNGKKYPVVLDTGASVDLFVNDIHIVENKLAIYPYKTSRKNSAGWGICQLPELSIGEVKFINWPCSYRAQHVELQVFGLPVNKDKAIIAGLRALREFKYIVFDAVKKQAEFSLENVFDPVNVESWAQYPFVIEESFTGNAFLLVKIPIAGTEIELQLDTGSGRGLAIAQELWEGIEKFEDVKLKRAKDLYPYIGWLDCKRAVIGKLQVGNRIVRNAKVSVFPDESPLVENCQGLLGMQYFRDTVIVLDFERELMWVRNK